MSIGNKGFFCVLHNFSLFLKKSGFLYFFIKSLLFSEKQIAVYLQRPNRSIPFREEFLFKSICDLTSEKAKKKLKQQKKNSSNDFSAYSTPLFTFSQKLLVHLNFKQLHAQWSYMRLEGVRNQGSIERTRTALQKKSIGSCSQKPKKDEGQKLSLSLKE